MTESVWGPVKQEMTDLLQSHPDDVPAVVDQLTKLQDILGRVPPLLVENPLCDFNKLYLTITESVLERLYAGKFADPSFLSRLDVEFAARYFDALRAWAGPDDCGVTTRTVWPSAIESGGLTTTCSSPERPLATSSSVPRSRWMFTFCRRTLLSRSTVATCAPSLRNRSALTGTRTVAWLAASFRCACT